MGKEYHTRRTTWVPAFLVVVSIILYHYAQERLRREGVSRSTRVLAMKCFSVFWDLYSAAPERRDSCEHSSEAKAFHDYVSIYLRERTDNICKLSYKHSFRFQGFVNCGYGVNGIAHVSCVASTNRSSLIRQLVNDKCDCRMPVQRRPP